MLDQIMNTSTLMKYHPHMISSLLQNDRELVQSMTRSKLQVMISHVFKPAHPTEVFKFIVGMTFILKIIEF